MRILVLLATLAGAAAAAAERPVPSTPADPVVSGNRQAKRDQPARAAPPAGFHRRMVSGANETYRVHVPATVRNRWVAITNVGMELAVSPRLVANDKRNWFSTDDIVAEIITGGMTDREKALAIWRFLVDHRYHDAPAHNGIEMHDPVRFLNVYGYGFCDDSATNFMVLAEKTGLRARVWGLSGHVVPEAYFEGGWRMLDPDGKIFYLEDDGHAIAGIKTLEQRPDLIRKYPSPYYKDAGKLVAIYTSTDDNKVHEGSRKQSEAVHTLAFTLRPGESLTRHHDNWGLYFSSFDKARPPRNTAGEHFGNGEFVFEPVLANNLFAKGADSVSNLRAASEGTHWILTSDDGEGTLVYRFASPYPYLDGAVRITGRGHIALAFSETGEIWTKVWETRAGETVDTTVPLGGQIRTREGRPMYTYRMKLTLNGQVQALRFQTDIQVAPASLPALEPGDNRIDYRDATDAERNVRIEFAYDVAESR